MAGRLDPPHIPILVQQSPNRARIIQVYNENLDDIRTRRFRFGNGSQRYHYRLSGDLVSSKRLTRDVLHTQRHAFRLNASCSVILQNAITDQIACFNNAAMFDQAPHVASMRDWRRVTQELSSREYHEEESMQRDST